MEASDSQRRQKIKNLVALHPEDIATGTNTLWEQMATQIIALVGEGGFNSLYDRSVFLTQSSFPWLAAAKLSPPDHRFDQLKTRLAEQTPDQASAASSLLLITFTDILAALIGEQITTRILRSAWGNDASDRTDKDTNNE